MKKPLIMLMLFLLTGSVLAKAKNPMFFIATSCNNQAATGYMELFESEFSNALKKEFPCVETLSDNQMAFRWGGLFGKGLQSVSPSKQRVPAYIPEANQAARTYARISDGVPHNSVLESMFNMSVTAHILGGCPIGVNAHSGVIDSRHEVFGHTGLYVMDGSAIPANVGVNPSLTITALTERAMSLFPKSVD